jgi:hypothetical protein
VFNECSISIEIENGEVSNANYPLAFGDYASALLNMTIGYKLA